MSFAAARSTTKEGRTVFDAIVHGKGRAGRRISKALNPGAEMPYPSRMLGSKAKVPRESYYGWKLIPTIRSAFPNLQIPDSLIKLVDLRIQ